GHVYVAVAEEAQWVFVQPGVSETVFIPAEEPWFDGGKRRIDIFAAGNQLRGAASVFLALINETAGFQNRHDQRTGGIRIGIDERPGATQHLLWMIGPDRLAGGQGEAPLFFDRLRAPGLACAETVDAPGVQM